MPAAFTAADVRERFPLPVVSTPPTLWSQIVEIAVLFFPLLAKGSYCVGGAFCKYMDSGLWGFPADSAVAKWLQVVNDDLPPDQARQLAQSIIEANDRGDFEIAWEHLDAALRAGAE